MTILLTFNQQLHTMQCILCNKPSLISIPGSTESISICDTCTTNPPPSIHPEIIKKINQQISLETFQYLLSQIKENKRLVSLLSSQSQQLSQINSDTKHNIIPELQSQITSLQTTNTDLKTQIQSLQSQLLTVQEQLKESVTLKSLQEIIIESMPSTETVEDNTDQIAISIDTLQKTANKILNILELPLPPKKQPTVIIPEKPAKTPDIPADEYEEGIR